MATRRIKGGAQGPQLQSEFLPRCHTALTSPQPLLLHHEAADRPHADRPPPRLLCR